MTENLAQPLSQLAQNAGWTSSRYHKAVLQTASMLLFQMLEQKAILSAEPMPEDFFKDMDRCAVLRGVLSTAPWLDGLDGAQGPANASPESIAPPASLPGDATPMDVIRHCQPLAAALVKSALGAGMTDACLTKAASLICIDRLAHFATARGAHPLSSPDETQRVNQGVREAASWLLALARDTY